MFGLLTRHDDDPSGAEGDDEKIGPDSISLEKNVYTFGRSDAAMVVIANKKISADHCKLTIETHDDKKNSEHVYILLDTSSNGTYVNGVKIGNGKSKKLQDGDVIGLGGTKAKQLVKYKISFPKPVAEDEEEDEEVGKKRPYAAMKRGATIVVQNDDSDDNKEEEESQQKPVPPPQSSQPLQPLQPLQPPQPSAAPDEMEMELTCAICADIFYKPIEVFPCLHSFCAPCYSEWMSKSSACPECRTKVDKVGKNVKLANIVEYYLKQHPDKKRKEEEIKELDKKNKITDESLRTVPKKKHGHNYDDDDEDDDGYDDEEDEDEDEDEEDEDDEYSTCKECVTANPVDGHKCAAINAFQSPPAHLACLYCQKAVPRRPGLFATLLCGVCCRTCCKSYFNDYYVQQGQQVQQPVCADAVIGNIVGLKELQSHTGFTIVARYLNNNQEEVERLKAYLQAKGISMIDVWKKMLANIGTTQWKQPPLIQLGLTGQEPTILGTPPPNQNAISPTTPSCQKCAYQLFNANLLQFRKSIDKSEIETALAKKFPNCWYGYECRTQTHNQQHGAQYNHICDPDPRRNNAPAPGGGLHNAGRGMGMASRGGFGFGGGGFPF